VPWVVLGLDNRFVVPTRHGMMCRSCRHDVPIMPKNLNPTRHEAREDQAGPARHGSPSSSALRGKLQLRRGSFIRATAATCHPAAAKAEELVDFCKQRFFLLVVQGGGLKRGRGGPDFFRFKSQIILLQQSIWGNSTTNSTKITVRA